ncbi:MAG: hypothetical protein ACPLPS_00195, partial [bacterium]
IGIGLMNRKQIEALFIREKILSLSDIFGLSPKGKKELQALPRLGAPLFMRVDEKRWCQASVLKGGEAEPQLLPRRKDRRNQKGAKTKRRCL